jgi:glycosyltransferase involved in cell wall biosynthesis
MDRYKNIEHKIIYNRLLEYAPKKAKLNIRDLIAALDTCKDLLTEWSLQHNRSPFGGLSALIKKTIRFFLRWYINPIATQQSRINNTLINIIKEQQEQIEILRSIKTAEINDSEYKLDESDIDKVRSFIKTPVVNTIEKRHKIAVFTPLSPIRSGIALYSEDILLKLKEYIDIDIFIDEGYVPDNPKITENFNILPYTDFERRSLDYDTILYQMGNNIYHWYMVYFIQKYSGIVVLHDINLAGLALYETQHDSEGLIKIAESERDKKYLDHVRDYLNGKPYEEFIYPLNSYIINFADGIIVHSDFARKEIYKKNIDKLSITIPLYADLSICRKNVSELRAKYNFLEKDILVISFGHVAPSKRPAEVLKAFAKLLTQKPDENLKLVFVGELHDESLLKVVEDLGISQNVIFTGYTTDEVFFDYISMCDICVNLRYPYKGENSATLSQALACGKPTIITDIGSFSELPDNVCIKVSANTATEIEEIYNALKNLIFDSSLRRKYGRAAIEYVQQHLDINKIVLQYRDFITDIVLGKKPAVTEDIVKQIAYEMLNDNSPDLHVKAYSIAEILADYAKR